MAITHRKGDYNDYDPSRMRPAEFGITLMNDPKAVDGRAVHIAFAAGEDKTLMTFEDAEGMIEDAAEEATAAATSQAQQYATNSQNSATESRSYAKGGTSSRSGEDTDNAMYYKNQAANSATAASNSAAAASGSASTASTKASEAATSATNASGSATAAATSAGQAASSATAASGSATAASGSASAAQEMSYTAEAWAVGTKNGIDVGSSDPQYHNNSKYYLEQAEEVAESIPEDYSDLSDDVDQLKNALPTKAEQDGAYSDLTAGQMLSKNESADSVPYNFRAVGQDATLEYTDAIVGGSVVNNQLAPDTGFTSTGGTVTVGADGKTVFTADAEGQQAYKLINNVVLHIAFISVTFKTSTATSDVKLRAFGYDYNGIATASWQTISIVTKPYTVSTIGVIDRRTTGWDAITIDNAQFIDLTQALGTTIADYVYSLETATSGSGLAWLRKHFPKLFTYQPYNAGEIVSVQGLSQHVTTGFNQWDEEWEVGKINDSTGQNQSDTDQIRSKNYIQVLPNTTYYIRFPNLTGKFYCYDNSKGFIGTAVINNSKIETPSNCYYIRFRSGMGYGTTYNHDICINLSDPTRNGEYEPYQKRTYPLDDSLTLRGILKLDASNNLYADGDRYLPDGTVQRRYGIVDLGTLTWTYLEGSFNEFSSSIPDIQVNNAYAPNMICSKYPTVAWHPLSGVDKVIYKPNNTAIYVMDSTYTDAATFKTAMSGVYMVYELAEPTTETADPYTVPQIVDPDGTEEYVSTSIAPVGHESRYPLDIAGRLDKILTMPTANGTYTLRATVNNGAVSYAWVST